MEGQTNLPIYQLVEARPENVKISVSVLTQSEGESVPEAVRQAFNSSGYAVHHDSGLETHFITNTKISKCTISKNTYVSFSQNVSELQDFLGVASDVLSIHKFVRKQKKPAPVTLYINKETKNIELIISLSQARNQSKEHANGRGDEEGTPQYFQKLARAFATSHGVQITVFKGQQLVQNGFRLMHAVGRGSKNVPVFINLKYNGNEGSDKWISFVGKGVCFDAGGLNIKPASGMKDMFLDKCGAVSVFTAFQYIVKQKLKINLTVSLGFVQNFISSNSYRPSDIIKSRKGLTVEIGNTDAEGRLVLADCMHWTQENYNTEVMIELSTLTGAIIIALGNYHAGLYSNSDNLSNDLIAAGNQIHQFSWRMPLLDYHRDYVKHKTADITNHTGKTQASSSQAAAFLQNFVEKNTQWIHLDIAGTSIIGGQGSGYGARLLLQYARNFASK